MFNLRQLARRMAYISFHGRRNPTVSSFGTSSIRKIGYKGTKSVDAFFFDTDDDRNLPRVVDIDMDKMMEDDNEVDDDDIIDGIKTDLILPDDVKREIISKVSSPVENVIPVDMHDGVFSGGLDDRNLPRVVDIDMDAMMEDEDDDSDIIFQDDLGAIKPELLLPEKAKTEIAPAETLSSAELDPIALEIKSLLRNSIDEEQNKRFAEKMVGTRLDLADIKLPEPTVPEE